MRRVYFVTVQGHGFKPFFRDCEFLAKSVREAADLGRAAAIGGLAGRSIWDIEWVEVQTQAEEVFRFARDLDSPSVMPPRSLPNGLGHLGPTATKGRFLAGTLALLLISSVARADDGGTPTPALVPSADAIDVNSASILQNLPDGGTALVLVNGGCWTSTTYCLGFDKELVEDRAKVATYETESGWPGLKWIVGSALVGAAMGGIFFGWLGWELHKPPTPPTP